MIEKLLILEETVATSQVREILKNRYEIILYKEFIKLNKDEIKKIAAEITGVICRLKYNINRTFLSQFIKLRFLATVTTGITHIDLDFLYKKRIKLFTLNDSREILKNITGTSELAITLALTLYHKIIDAHKMTSDGNWDRNYFYREQLSNQEAGIIGFGRLGQNIGRALSSLGMGVSYNDKVQLSTSKKFKFCTLEKILTVSKLIFISASYRPPQDFILKKKDLKTIKNFPIIINISRAQLIDPNFIYEGLEKKVLSGFCTDVLFNENLPNKELQKLYSYNNVIVTPHIGGATSDSIEITEVEIANLIIREI